LEKGSTTNPSNETMRALRQGTGYTLDVLSDAAHESKLAAEKPSSIEKVISP